MLSSNYQNDESKLEIRRFGLRIAGAAGDGLQSTGLLIQKYLNRLGYYVVGHPGTQSTIRGGHVWQHVEFANYEIHSFNRKLNLLIALNTQSVDIHLRDIVDNGFLLINKDKVNIDIFNEEISQRRINVIAVPLTAISRNIDLRKTVLSNTVAVGVLFALLNLPSESYVDTLTKRFSDRSNLLKINIVALKEGFDYFTANHSFSVPIAGPTLEPLERFIISGNEMIALGAVAAGLKYLAQYPITPASSILTYLSKRARKFGIVVRQAEDELAAICMCIGASYAGARVMTASSGPGISLMSEAFGYASMTETPIVIINAMRAGPSTGIPTKMEQADLYSAMYMSHGESPRAIFAPRNIREAFDVTVRAFNIADKYQLPVIILSDFALSESTKNLDPFNMDVNNDRGLIWKEPTSEYPEFKRYQLTKSGVSPRAFPGTKDAMYVLVGAEHDELSHSLSGNLCGLHSSAELREQMFNKRFKKMELLREEMTIPEFYGEQDADNTILCWGSTQGAVVELVDELNRTQNQTWNMLSFVDMFPFPYEKVKKLLAQVNHSIILEVNYTGQFENLIHHHLDWKPDKHIRPMGGETLTPSFLLQLFANIEKMDGNTQ